MRPLRPPQGPCPSAAPKDRTTLYFLRLQKVRQEFWRQTQLALLVLAGFLLVAWLFRGRPPWEGGPRPGAGGSSRDDLAAALLQGGGMEEEGGVPHAEL